MIRKQIRITTKQKAELKRLSQATEESEAEVVRQALASYLQGGSTAPSRLRAWQEEREFIQSLLDSTPMQSIRSWTREELNDRYN